MPSETTAFGVTCYTATDHEHALSPDCRAAGDTRTGIWYELSTHRVQPHGAGHMARAAGWPQAGQTQWAVSDKAPCPLTPTELLQDSQMRVGLGGDSQSLEC